MARHKGYREAEQKVAAARRSLAKELDLNGLKLTELPESLGQLTLLQELDLSDNQLPVLPELLGQLTQLQSLNLSNNRLTTLPEWLGQLTQLQTLSLYNNQLSALPESLSQLTQLQSLNLSNNRLMALPDWLGQLTQLQSLDLSFSRLTALPESLGQLTQLQTLSLYNNQLTALPESLGQLAQLQVLSLSNNPLQSLPPEVGCLHELRSLTLGNTNIQTLPITIHKMKLLEFFVLSRTLLKRLPDWFGDLKSLKGLDLSNAKTVVLEWTQSSRAWTFDQSVLSERSFIELPQSLTQLPSLQELYLHGNSEIEIPAEILGPEWGAKPWPSSYRSALPSNILEYYFSTRGDQGSALRELKLLVVGRGGAGKTSLVKRLNREPLDPRESETHGINIRPLELECFDGPVTARVWDFGGQHVLHAMHEFFLTARSLYLLVLGEREDMAERDAAYWLQLIRSYAPQAPVVIALNKNQGRAREMDREALEQAYGPIVAWVATECADGYDETIEELRTALTKAADGMSEVRDLFPAKWWKVKEWLENMNEPYLDFATYQKQCNQLGEQDEQQQATLAARLNDLGIAINYAEDERLHDTTVLRPDWLANGIYAILRANDSHHEQPLAPDAVLTKERLGPIYAGAERLKMLKAADYPESMWPFLLRLMNLFQLAFPIDDKGETLLAPTLLPLEPPADCEEPTDKDRTQLRYEFAVVPAPLLPKLLVRTFSLIAGERRWRRGAILQFGAARARVWATQDERWVHLTAVGDQEDRHELLTMLRVTLRELFAEYRNLQVVEQWEYNGDWVPRKTLESFGVLPVEAEEEALS